jgi:hypothetical protein
MPPRNTWWMCLLFGVMVALFALLGFAVANDDVSDDTPNVYCQPMVVGKTIICQPLVVR